jgi:hypothetical protein
MKKRRGSNVAGAKTFTLSDLNAIVGVTLIHLTDQELKESRRAFLNSRMQRLESKKG